VRFKVLDAWNHLSLITPLVLSNYQTSLGAKAIFTHGVDGGQVSSVVLVDSTAIDQADADVRLSDCWRRIADVVLFYSW
jgi:hypothetical protein